MLFVSQLSNDIMYLIRQTLRFHIQWWFRSLTCVDSSIFHLLINIGIVWNLRIRLYDFHQRNFLLGIRFFRIVHAPVFLRCFASDRRHMKDSSGNWIAQPPTYEPIVAEGKRYNLIQVLPVWFKATSDSFQLRDLCKVN